MIDRDTVSFTGHRPDQDANPQAFNAGLLAWESVRLFWYAVKGNKDGINEKHGYVLEALRRFELSKEWPE